MKLFRFSNISVLFILMAWVANCGTTSSSLPVTESQISETQAGKTQQPINVTSKNFPPFGFAKIRSDVTPGSVIAEVYDGIMRVKKETVYEEGQSETEKGQEMARKVILGELSKNGYKISSQTTLFRQDESLPPRFLIGATTLKKNAQIFLPKAGNYTEVYREYEWEVFDNVTNKVIYKTKTSGYYRESGVKPEAIAEGTRNAFNILLAQQSLIDAIEKSTALFKQSKAVPLSPATYYTSSPSSDKSKDVIQRASNAVFAIRVEGGHGSGFIINPHGYAVTNYHVVKDKATVEAVFPDGKKVEASVAKIVPDKDLALLKLSVDNHPYLPLERLDNIAVGQEVYAIGTPLDLSLSRTVTKGIISAIRKGKSLTLIQTDASINPGNSGGPLIDSLGKAVGAITLRLSPSRGYVGVGFAISGDDIVNYLQLKKSETK